MFAKIFLWLRGYLLIAMKGHSPERFINLCNKNGIYIWNLQNFKGSYQFQLMAKDYKKLKPIARKTGTIPYIDKKRGLPFILYGYRKRKAFLIGILIFSLVLYLLSLNIWNISIKGGRIYTPEVLTEFLKENDVYVGVKAKDVDCRQIEELIRGTYKDIGWVSAEIKGTNLIIKITETNMPAPAKEKMEPSHIVASKNGIITNIVTRTGTPMIEEGTVVKKGDILVSGVVDIIGDNEILVNKEPVVADADIMAKTYYKYEDSFPLKYLDKEYTGKSKKDYVINFLLKELNLYRPRISYTKYDIITEEYVLQFSENFYLPFGYSTISYRQYQEIEKKYTKEEATELANTRLNQVLEKLKEKDVLILENNVKITIDNNSCTAKGNIIVQESIIDYKKVLESEWRMIEEDELTGGSD